MIGAIIQWDGRRWAAVCTVSLDRDVAGLCLWEYPLRAYLVSEFARTLDPSSWISLSKLSECKILIPAKSEDTP